MNFNAYESLSYKRKFIRAMWTGFVTLAVALFIITPTIYCWRASVLKRQVLREAKNVVLNMDLLAAEFRATGAPVRDINRPNGLAESAEERIRSCSAAKGDIQLIAWDSEAGKVTSVTYQRSRYLCEYTYHTSDDTKVWNVYYRVNHFHNDNE